MLLLYALMIQAQETFERIYERPGDDMGKAVVVLPDGYLLAGYAEGEGANLSDAYLMRTDLAGDTVWTKLLGYKGTDLFNALIPSGADTFTAFGTYSHTNPGRSDFYLVKFTGSGDTLWTKNIFTAENAYGYSLAATYDGYMLCGYQETGKGVPEIFVSRTNVSGDTLWTRIFGQPLSGVGTSVVRAADNNYVACGYIDQPGNFNRDIFLVKFNPWGDTVWTRTIDLGGYEVAWAIHATSDQGFVITGYHWSSTATNTSLLALKTDAQGLVQWQKSFGDVGLDIGYDGIQTTDGGFAFTGLSTAASGVQSLYVVRTTSTGDTLWTRRFGTPPKSVGNGLRETDDGGFIIAGANNSVTGQLYDVFAVRTDGNGLLTGIPGAGAVPGEFRVFPNPSGGTITFRCPKNLVSIEVTDVTGRTRTLSAKDTQEGNDLVLDLSPTPPGLCILRLVTLQGVITEKVIIK